MAKVFKAVTINKFSFAKPEFVCTRSLNSFNLRAHLKDKFVFFTTFEGKDMSLVMGPSSSMGGSNPSGFDASSINAQLGSQGMSLNMFGGTFITLFEFGYTE